jgi:hypothetical protein
MLLNERVPSIAGANHRVVRIDAQPECVVVTAQRSSFVLSQFSPLASPAS